MWTVSNNSLVISIAAINKLVDNIIIKNKAIAADKFNSKLTNIISNTISINFIVIRWKCGQTFRVRVRGQK